MSALSTGNADILVGEVRTRQAHAGRDAGVPGSSRTLGPGRRSARGNRFGPYSLGMYCAPRLVGGAHYCIERTGLDRFTPRAMNSGYHPTLGDLEAQGSIAAALLERAGALARQVFGRRVFVRAVVEVSNFCRENCRYCGMRRDNRALTRFRATTEQLAEWIISQCPPSVRDINLQGGEDPVAVREVVLPLIRILRRETRLGISVCLGTLTSALYDELREAGARFYVLKFETSDRGLYSALCAPGKLAERLSHIRLLAAEGWQVSSGFIVGLPQQTPAQLLHDLEVARELPLAGCSVSPFIAGESTPLSGASPGDVAVTLNCMAMLRLMRPAWLVPAVSALGINGAQDGYRRGLGAGANLVTINLTPPEERESYLLYKRDRVIMTEERVLNEIAKAGLTPATESLLDRAVVEPVASVVERRGRVQAHSAAVRSPVATR